MRLIVGRNPGECVLSVEDPPEYKLPGVIQLPVSNLRSDEDRDVAYADAVAAALRSDPDRIMIGEVRTRATAHHAFKAAMTGHQVLTTLHANDALGVVPRFRDIGVDSYKLRDPSLVRAVLMQRLLKRLCPRCRRAVDPCRAGLSRDLARRLTGFLQGRPVFLPGPGCGAACRQGFVGRTVVAELILPDQKLLSLLCTGERQAAEKHWKERLGGLSMLDNAILKIGDGHIDPLQIDNKIFI